MEDLTARALDLVIDVQLTAFEVDGLPGESEDFTPAEPEAEHQDPGCDQWIFARHGIGEESALPRRRTTA